LQNIQMYTNIKVDWEWWATDSFKKLGSDRFFLMFLKEVSYAHKGYNYLAQYYCEILFQFKFQIISTLVFNSPKLIFILIFKYHWPQNFEW